MLHIVSIYEIWVDTFMFIILRHFKYLRHFLALKRGRAKILKQLSEKAEIF
jgi:hypothetical protein